MERIKQLLGSEKFRGARNQDIQIKLDLKQHNNLFADNEYQKIVDVGEQFNVERQKTSNYVIYGKIDPLFDDWSNRENAYPSLSKEDVAFDTFREDVGRNWVIQVVYPSEASIFSGHMMTISAFTGSNTIIISSNHSNTIEYGDILNIYDEFNKRFTYRVLNINSGITYQYITFEGELPPTLSGMSKSYITPKITRYNRSFKILTTYNDYYVYKSAFSTNIFGEQVYQFHFNKDINVKKDEKNNELLDFLGKPITEMYIAIVKTTTNIFKIAIDNNYTSYVSNGIKSDLSPTIAIPHILSPTTNEYIEKGNLYSGDIYEYNNNELTGETVEKIYHRFLYIKPNNNELFYYQPFYKMDIRKYSNGLENGNTATTSNIPSYASPINSTGEMMWRDLLDIGYIEENNNGVNYPFVSGRHYLYNDIKLYIRRVTPIASGTTASLSTFDYNQTINVNSTSLCR